MTRRKRRGKSNSFSPRGRASANHYDRRKIFVGGLASAVTSDDMREFFEQYGTVLDAVVMFDRDTRRSRGFGFVTFEDENVVNNLLKLGNEAELEKTENADAMQLTGKIVIKGKRCEIKSAQPKQAMANTSQSAMPPPPPPPAATAAEEKPPASDQKPNSESKPVPDPSVAAEKPRAPQTGMDHHHHQAPMMMMMNTDINTANATTNNANTNTTTNPTTDPAGQPWYYMHGYQGFVPVYVPMEMMQSERIRMNETMPPNSTVGQTVATAPPIRTNEGQPVQMMPPVAPYYPEYAPYYFYDPVMYSQGIGTPYQTSLPQHGMAVPQNMSPHENPYQINRALPNDNMVQEQPPFFYENEGREEQLSLKNKENATHGHGTIIRSHADASKTPEGETQSPRRVEDNEVAGVENSNISEAR
eukprot:CAMPEP_0118693286 /NCGR_PEP_ID=MMETSP0800-20121206/11819_1 /TAXON_ID=210618 ORGANISM="Striatella unipunctata, Strain CCMP2910" /NCGR_SAMPLE_ID=MMETSP0800 /ASSEMBLY_ACC=CAM_ASM_000638 /LENGTH=415 /DNA_ID=CAMNT_0006591495 /DNA_START=99 /DNA_END=1346 /DNA_ORIENTATION=+